MQYDLYILYNWNSAELNASCAYIMDTMVIIVTAMITMVIAMAIMVTMVTTMVTTY